MPDVLPDLLGYGLIVVFCGTAASAESARKGAYYANPGNRFWRSLFEVRMTPRFFAPDEFRQLLSLRIGLTDVAKGVAGSDRELRPADFDPAELNRKISRFRPRIVAFTSKAAFRSWRSERTSRIISYGWQMDIIGQSRVFVLPSPSGAARRYWDISYWETLAAEYRTRLMNQ